MLSDTAVSKTALQSSSTPRWVSKMENIMNIGAIFTTPGIGGIITIVVLVSAVVIYAGLTYWIMHGGKKEQTSKMERK